ncbi:MAG: SGNH/GDSL hydrolase family protein [Patescibacteria group bacterium]|nr:SGNH/GDSL hydrolase family protein [Patescibacteria group bacterium]
MITKRTLFIGVSVCLILLIIFVVLELVYIAKNGTPVDAPKIPRTSQTLSKNGPKLHYVVMGDSTSIGQGADYKDSYSYQSAQHIAAKYAVTLTNVGVSGARARDVQAIQLPQALKLHPDIVLLAIGANDVTHFTSKKAFERSVQQTIDGLRKDNCDLKIVVTGVPAMGSVDRFPPGARQLAGFRTRQLNGVYEKLITKNHLVSAPVAARTGPTFAADPTLFGPDKFHPNKRGYAVWTPVINEGLDSALNSTPDTCK